MNDALRPWSRNVRLAFVFATAQAVSRDHRLCPAYTLHDSVFHNEKSHDLTTNAYRELAFPTSQSSSTGKPPDWPWPLSRQPSSHAISFPSVLDPFYSFFRCALLCTSDTNLRPALLKLSVIACIFGRCANSIQLSVNGGWRFG